MSYPDTIEYEPSFVEEEALVYSSCCYQRWCSERLCPFRWATSWVGEEYIYTKDNR